MRSGANKLSRLHAEKILLVNANQFQANHKMRLLLTWRIFSLFLKYWLGKLPSRINRQIHAQ